MLGLLRVREETGMEKVMSSICEYEWKILKDYFEDLYNIDT